MQENIPSLRAQRGNLLGSPRTLCVLAMTLILFSIPAYAAEAPVLEESEDDPVLRQMAMFISNQIRPCWRIPASGNPAPVQAMIEIEPTGKMKFLKFADEVTPEQQELAKSVEDAINDPNCNPIQNLPPKELYYMWQNLTLLFAPKN